MTRICIVTQYLGLGGGVHTKLLAFLRFAETQGCICDVYYPMEGPRPTRQEEELRSSEAVRNVYSVRVDWRAPHFWRAYQFSRRFRLRTGYDFHMLVAGPLLLGLPYVRNQIRFAAWVASSLREEAKSMPKTRLRHHLFYNPITLRIAGRFEMACAQQAELIMGVSRYTVSHLKREFGIPSEKLRVVPVPVDTEVFSPAHPRRGCKPSLLSVSRLDRRKDLQTLLKAFRAVREQEDVELRIVGGGPERAGLERLVSSLELVRDVSFLGEVSFSQLIEEYRNATLFVSSPKQEGLGIVFLEAMASGLPVVTTDCGGSADPVVSGETGFLVRVGDSPGLADAILRLLAAPETAQGMGNAGRARAERDFSVPAVHALFRAALAEKLGQCHPPRSGPP